MLDRERENMAKIGKLLVRKGVAQGASCTVTESEEASIGRNLGCSIPVPDIKLSRIHCVVRHIEQGFEVLDNNSTNGTFVNGSQINFCQTLSSGDIIEIGDSEIEFSYENVADDNK